MPPQPLVKPRKCNKVTGDSEEQVHRTLKELFEYLQICGNITGNPPTTPGGMTVHPVTTGTTLNIFEAPSKLWATILHGFFPQLTKTRLRAPCVRTIRPRNTLRHYALEVLLTSKELKKEGRNVVS